MHCSRYIKGAAAGALALAALPPAFAAGTTAGTSVSNTANAAYIVSGVTQPTASSNADTFLVDRRVNLTVAEVGDNFTDVAPGSANEALKFTVSNSTNGAIDIRLIYQQDATGAAGPSAPHAAAGATDDFNTGNVRFYLDDADSNPATVDGNGTFEIGTDIELTAAFLDNVGADVTRTVFVVTDIPNSPLPADGDTSSGSLIAVANSDGTGGATNDYTETSGADTQGAVDTVLADAAGDADAGRDGRHSDDDAYRVRRAVLTLTKSSVVIDDPFNGTSNPKRIPGATLEYCVHIANAGSRSADTVVISDAIPANTTYVAGSIRTAATGSGTACTSGTGNSEDDNATDNGGDETDPNGADFNVTTAGAVTVRTPSIAATNGTFKALFRVTINN